MRLARIGAVVALTAGLVAAPVAASGRPMTAVTPPPGLTMEAAVMLDGHARVGSWMAIDVRLKNDGPPIVGELRITGGTQGRTRFGTLVQAPTQSDQTHRLYAQPPGFGRELEVSLYSGETTIATAKAAYTIHDGTQMVVGIVAERPGDIIGDLDLLPNMNNVKPLTVGLDAARPADARRGVGRARSPDLAGRRFVAAQQLSRSRHCVAGSPAAVGSSSRAARPVRPACRHSPTPSCPIDRRRRPTSPRPRSGRSLARCRTMPRTCRHCPGRLQPVGPWRRSGIRPWRPSDRTAQVP